MERNDGFGQRNEPIILYFLKLSFHQREDWTVCLPEANWVYKENDSGLNDIDITEDKVSAKLDKLRDNKAAGADDLLPMF